MVLACDLEVDVNGEEIFFVDKEILSSFSAKLCKLVSISQPSAKSKTLKVAFHDIPGGPLTFELMTRFCYNNGRTLMTPSITYPLHYIARFMEIPALIKKTEKSIEKVSYWSWSEVVSALKQCEGVITGSSSLGVYEKLLDSLVDRIETATSDASPTRFSCDTKSTTSTKNSCHRTWWLEDLMPLRIKTIDKVIKRMVSHKLDHVLISRFLFYYVKWRIPNAASNDKRETIEAVIDLLCSLDRSCVSCKGLFGILRVSSSLNLSKYCRSRLESMIGGQIDRATLDDLLVPSPNGIESLYDVNLVLRFLKSFVENGDRPPITRLKRTGLLIDSYMAEVAPDSFLKPSTFLMLATMLPEEARDSHDPMFQAIDMYFEAHARLTEEDKLKICCSINYEKLSSESFKHLARNSKFPSRTAVRALVSQHTKLKSLLRDVDRLETIHGDGEQVVLCARKLDLSVENENLKAHIRGMQWRVMELERIFRKMQNQMAKVKKAKLSSTPNRSRSLPRLCS